MIEHLRAERTVVRQLFGGAGQFVETAGTRVKPGTVEIRVEGRPVAVGGSFQEAVAGTGSFPGVAMHSCGGSLRRFYTQDTQLCE